MRRLHRPYATVSYKRPKPRNGSVANCNDVIIKISVEFLRPETY